MKDYIREMREAIKRLDAPGTSLYDDGYADMENVILVVREFLKHIDNPIVNHVSGRVVGPWVDEQYWAYREYNGVRVAFIEKTPRVLNESGEWVYGDKGSSDLLGKDPKSRAWCDTQLAKMGYIIP